MKQTHLKYSSWLVTILSKTNGGPVSALPAQCVVEKVFEEIATEFVFQAERHENADNGLKLHYQCYIKTKIRTRKPTLLRQLAEKLDHPVERIRVDKMDGTREQAIAYCSKEDTRSAWCPTVTSKIIKQEQEAIYDQSDIEFLKDKDKRYPWQQEIIEKIIDEDSNIIKHPNDRTIIWITDTEGCTGKSKLVKYLCTNYDSIAKLSFGTANQLRSSVTQLGKRIVYIIDIPRTLGHDDSMNDVISVIEDLKNGFVVSSFYGSYNELIITPPHIVIFSNKECPINKLSKDRWEIYSIIDTRLQPLLMDWCTSHLGSDDERTKWNQ